MSENLKLVSGTMIAEAQRELERTYTLQICWTRQFQRVMLDAISVENLNTLSQDSIKRMALASVKMFIYIKRFNSVQKQYCRLTNQPCEDIDLQGLYALTDTIYSFIGALTIRSLVSTFPIDKDYDGDKFECKDYFYTVGELKKIIDWDKPIGRDNVLNLLWDYCNPDLQTVSINYMTAVEDEYEKKTGLNPIIQFMDTQMESPKPKETESTLEIIK